MDFLLFLSHQLIDNLIKIYKYQSHSISMDNNPKLIKAFQTKILDLSKQLQQAKAHNDKIKSQHLKISEAFQKSNRCLQQKIHQVKTLQNRCTDLEINLEEANKNLKDSQIKLKQFSENMVVRVSNQRKMQIKGKSFDYQLNKIREDNINETVKELTKQLEKQNDRIISLHSEFHQVNTDNLKSMISKKKQITALKHQNQSLKSTVERYKKINENTNLLASTDSYVLVAENLTLQERLRVAQQKIKAYQREFSHLKNEKNKKQQFQQNLHVQQSSIFDYPSTNAEEQANEYLKIMKQNKNIRQQLDELKIRHQILVQQFPEYVSNEEQITGFLQKNERILQLTKECENNRVCLNAQEEQIQALLKQKDEKFRKINSLMKNGDQDRQFYHRIIDKFVKFLNENNTHYRRFGVETILLTEEEQQFFNKKKTPIQRYSTDQQKQLNRLNDSLQTAESMNVFYQAKVKEYEASMNNSQDKIAKLQTILTLLSKKIENFNNNGKRLKKNRKRSDELSQISQSAMDEEMNQRQKSDEIGNNDEEFMKILGKVQLQRNKYLQQSKQKQSKIIKLMTQIALLKQKQDPITINQVHFPFDHSSTKFQKIFPTFQVNQSAKSQEIILLQLGTMKNNFEREKKKWENELIEKQKNHQNQINELKIEIKKIQMELREIKTKERSYVEKINQLNEKILAKDKPNMEQMASIMEMEDNFADNADNFINTLSHQSIDDLEKVLRGHENILKNILNSYQKLKERYVKLENAYLSQSNRSKSIQGDQNDIGGQSAQHLSSLVKMLEGQLKMSEAKLKQSETNCIILEFKLQETQKNSANSLQNLQKQNQLLKKSCSQLREQVQKFRSEQTNSFNIDQQKQPISGGAFPQEVQFLMVLLDEKRQEINHLKQEISKKNQLLLQQNRSAMENPVKQRQAKQFSSEINELKKAQLQKLEKYISQGSLHTVIDKAITKLKQYKKQKEEQRMQRRIEEQMMQIDQINEEMVPENEEKDDQEEKQERQGYDEQM